MSFQSIDALVESVQSDAGPPDAATAELRSLWLAKKGQWDAAHDIAQDIDTEMGSWIHGYLHLVEGDLGNAGYWYSRAGKPARGRGEEEAAWREIVAVVLNVER